MIRNPELVLQLSNLRMAIDIYATLSQTMCDGQIWPLRFRLLRFRMFDSNLSVLLGAALGLHFEPVLLKRRFYYARPQGSAIASSSTSAFFGSVLTATQLRAGLWVNHLAYSSFMA